MTGPVPGGMLLVAAGAAVGALLRAGAVGLTPDALDTAWTVALINVVGSFALGALPALRVAHLTPRLSAFLGPGLLGGFTTVSTYALTTRDLAADRPLLAGLHLAATLALALAAAALGRAVVRHQQARA